MTHDIRRVLLTVLCSALCVSAIADPSLDSLRQEFLSPPDTARPRVWWRWVNGNVTPEGIRLDLEWMQRVGVGGAQIFEGGYDKPELIEQRLVFNSPAWRSTLRTTAQLADRLGLELGIASSPGWHESGGPWVTPEQAMKKLVWTRTQVRGGKSFDGRLPQPPATVGPFLDVPVNREGETSFAGPAPLHPIPELYRDIAVLAYRLPAREPSMAELDPKVTSSAGRIDSGALWRDGFAQPVTLPFGELGQPAWIQFDFGRPVAASSLSLGLTKNAWYVENVDAPPHAGAELQSSADGIAFQHVANLYDSTDDTPQGIPPIQSTMTFAPVTARYFRLLLPTPPFEWMSPSLAPLLGPKPSVHLVTQLVLHTLPRVNRFEQKAAYFLDSGLNEHPTPSVASQRAIDPASVLDLTSRLRPDGTLHWQPPSGHWEILRLGYSLLGTTNTPAALEATGLEVDKLDRSAVKAYVDTYLGLHEAATGSDLIGRRGLRAMVNDSIEAGQQNWTPSLPTEFARRRGYELRPWLPALTGRILGSAERTDAFLWDFRRTLAELLTEGHYGQIAASLHARGMVHYGEGHEVSRAFIGDGMDVKRQFDIPMAALWVPGFPLEPPAQNDADIRESASVAHLYGKHSVAAEALTTLGLAPEVAYAGAPESLKTIVDRALVHGVNLFVLNTSVHQPLRDGAPGVTLGPFGQWFTRHETWAEQAQPWMSYLARSSHLLQQGRFVADVLYYYGQDSNVTALFARNLPPVPTGYAFDFANAHALTVLSVQDGSLVASSGMRYRLLVLDARARRMSLDVLKSIARLVSAGATVSGDKPEATPSLADDADEFRSLVDALWGSGDEVERRYGAGRILSKQSMADALARMSIPPDFSDGVRGSTDTIGYVHRQLHDGDLYFISNRVDRAQSIEGRFRVSGKLPELWHADTGRVAAASYRQDNGHTVVTLQLDPHDAVFVVFRRPALAAQFQVPESSGRELARIGGPWKVRFQAGRGAPTQATLSALSSWTEHADPGIKYFSGTADYETDFKLPASWRGESRRIELELGAVKNVVEVRVNGQPAGILWKAPFRIDVTALLRAGNNRLSARVTNLWPNRLIGDRQRNATPIATTTFNPYSADAALLPSGLLGPVTLVAIEPIAARPR